ncbi:MAG: UPF0147 family protein [Candidatus Diapherotrites archaeon]|nr:UPF0147 family protein [Candidatus Diapherotrites archaeon]
MAKEKKDERAEYIAELMDSVIDDTSVPRNIRAVVKEAKDKMQNSNEKKDIRITSSIYTLEDISNDVNMPVHTRTEIWQIISELEAVREKSKETK